jgi:hypothetical protein
MWHLDNILIVALANVDLLLPLWIFADDQRTYALAYQEVNDAT